uniref:uncharacterized protein LOC104265777 n=1 Tax=Ciona intestinalis TaxID=7719 RepID=UPI000521C27B|nr:uncharacterized protein LOC104265777 [Ciona intestinalis]|eukprot:XP_009858835.1 uncharacterized protein LOC104265777 [Ciona intestinalis]
MKIISLIAILVCAILICPEKAEAVHSHGISEWLRQSEQDNVTGRFISENCSLLRKRRKVSITWEVATLQCVNSDRAMYSTVICGYCLFRGFPSGHRTPAKPRTRTERFYSTRFNSNGFQMFRSYSMNVPTECFCP